VTVHIRIDAQQAFSIRMVPEQSDTEPLLRQTARACRTADGGGLRTQDPDGGTR
jgi:hypothetical protein